MWIFSLLIILLIGLSRIYIGVHWFGDVYIGWLFGIIILVLVLMLEKPIKHFMNTNNSTLIYLGLALLGFIIMLTL